MNETDRGSKKSQQSMRAIWINLNTSIENKTSKHKIKYVCTDAGGEVGEHGPHRFARIEKGTEVERDNLLMLAPSP